MSVARFQKTLAGNIAVRGIGLHSGKTSRVVLSPSAVGSGVRIFGKGGRGGRVETLAHAPSKRCSAVFAGADKVDMVEHLLAAVAVCRLTNVDIQVDGPEVPILDGSALPWLRLVEAAGTVVQPAPETRLAVTRPFAFSHGSSSYLAVPGRRRVAVRIEYPGTPIGSQEAEADESGFRWLAEARTFALKSEIDALMDAGLAAGGSLDNALVVAEKGPLNPGGYRFENECAMHKALDLLGDMMLSGHAVDGAICSLRPGHEANRAFMAAMAAAGAVTWPMEPAAAA